MERQPLDSLEYESTYLELRPDCERLSDSTDASLPARRRGEVADGRDAAAIGARSRSQDGDIAPSPAVAMDRFSWGSHAFRAA
jgi:hypothetical protein